mgnify:FL=1
MSEKKIAVVTGGARGIGKAIALELAKAGNLVVINYNGSEEKARETKAEIEAAGGQADILQCNVADFDACEAFFKAVAEKYGRVDILVNNAGVTKDGLLMKMSEEDFSRVVDINLKGTFNCIRHVSRMMLKQRSGRIISLSSVVGFVEMLDRPIMRHPKPGSSVLQNPLQRSWHPEGSRSTPLHRDLSKQT